MLKESKIFYYYYIILHQLRLLMSVRAVYVLRTLFFLFIIITNVSYFRVPRKAQIIIRIVENNVDFNRLIHKINTYGQGVSSMIENSQSVYTYQANSYTDRQIEPQWMAGGQMERRTDR